MLPLVVRWKTLTNEMLEELHQARKELSNRGSKWTDDKNWTGYLEDIGLARTELRHQVHQDNTAGSLCFLCLYALRIEARISDLARFDSETDSTARPRSVSSRRPQEAAERLNT